MELEVHWQEHEVGSYPLTVLTWDDAMRGALDTSGRLQSDKLPTR
jgi:hypothetical protein